MKPFRFRISVLDVFFLWTVPGTFGALILHQALTCSSILCGVE